MKKIVTTIISTMCCVCVYAQTFPTLFCPSDAESWGRAGVSLPVSAGAYSADNNASSMALYDGKMAASLSYDILQPKFASQTLISLGAFGKLGSRFAVGLTGKMLSYPEYQIYSDNGIPEQVNGTFVPKEFAFGAGASYRILDAFSVGVSVKFASVSRSPEESGTAFSAEVSAMYRKDALTASAAVRTLGDAKAPAMARAGVGYGTAFGLNAAAELDYVFNKGVMAGAGLEYWIKDMFALRAGYHYGSNKLVPGFASLGLAADIKGAKLDFAYLLASETLAGGMMLTLGYAF